MPIIKVAVTGPEASGKTLLASALARYYDVDLIEDYCSHYLDRKVEALTIEDLLLIAVKKHELINRVADKKSLIISDNDLLSLKIWSEFTFHRYPERLKELVDQQYFDLYLLNYPDTVPHLRREDPKLRNYFFNIYRKEFDDNKLPYVVLKEDFYSRKKDAVKSIDALISKCK